jgi:hypothetical protein
MIPRSILGKYDAKDPFLETIGHALVLFKDAITKEGYRDIDRLGFYMVRQIPQFNKKIFADEFKSALKNLSAGGRET